MIIAAPDLPHPVMAMPLSLDGAAARPGETLSSGRRIYACKLAQNAAVYR
jgi:hypothetical protein